MSETFAFQSDINQLLSLIINAFYSNKDVFLRELVSNASDALDKIRFMSLTNKTVLHDNTELEIQIIPDKEKKTLTILDTGIGMTKNDLINNLGVIAKSGTKEFIEKLAQSDQALSLIGQFGCGAYSAFLVANKVTFISKHNDDEQYVWESEAGGTFTITKDEIYPSLGRGTAIILHMKDDQLEYLEEAKIREIVKKHSEFISYPIKLEVEKEIEKQGDNENKEDIDGTVEAVEDDENTPLPKRVKIKELQVINTQKPVWMRKPEEVTKEEYAEFYKAISNDWEEHLAVKHFSVEGQLDFKAVLYVPQRLPFDFMEGNKKPKNIKLYVRRVFIMDDCEYLFPEYFSFIKGVVDSDDLPLNVSREMLQQNKILKVIKKNLIKRVIEMFNEIAENKEDYAKFWEHFGRNIKWAVHEDQTNREKLLELVRFKSSKSQSELTTLKDYITRMPADQKHIYYITGENQKSVENSPFIEKLKSRNYEVLYMVEPIDEYMVQNIREFQDKTFKCASKEGLDMGENEDEKQHFEELKKNNEDLCKKLKTILGDKVAKVVISERIVDTPCVLVTDEYGLSGNMERILKTQALRKNPMMDHMRTNRILEINVEHPIICSIKQSMIIDTDNEKQYVSDLVNLLFEVSLINSGFSLEDSSSFSKRIFNIINASLSLDDNNTSMPELDNSLPVDNDLQEVSMEQVD